MIVSTEPASNASVDSDQALMLRYFRDRNLEAMGMLLERYTNTAYRLALTHFKNPMDAEDAVQMAFLQVLLKGQETLSNPDPEKNNVRGWIMKIVVNCCRMKAREESRRTERQKAADLPSPHMPPDHEQAEIQVAALKTLKGLPEHYRVPIWMHILEGFSCKEVSEVLEVPEPTVRKQISRGLEHIQKSLIASGIIIGATVIPKCLASAPLPVAPLALSSSWKVLVAKNAITAATSSIPAANAGSNGIAAILNAKMAMALAALLAVVVFVLLSRSIKPAPPVATLSAAPAPFVSLRNSILDRKLNVAYRRAHLPEVLHDLELRVGLKSAFPGARPSEVSLTSNLSNQFEKFLFDLQSKDITIEQLVTKLRDSGDLILEHHGTEAVFWEKCDTNGWSTIKQEFLAGNVNERCESIYKAGRLGCKDIYPLLFGALNDDSEAVVAQSIFCLEQRHLTTLCYGTGLGDAVKRMRMLATAQNNAAYKPALLRVLGATREPLAIDYLLSILNDPDAYTRGNAALGLGLSQQLRIVEPLAARLDVETNSYARVSIAESLARISGDSVVFPLLRLLNDPNIMVRYYAIIGLGRSRDNRAIAPLFALLNHTEIEMKICAISALARMEDKQVADTLITEMRKMKVPHIWVFLAESHNSLFISALKSNLEHGDTILQLDSADALNRYHDPEAKYSIAPILSLLQHSPDASIRARAAIILGSSRDPDALEVLLAAASDPSPAVLHAVIMGVRLQRDLRASQQFALQFNKPDAQPVRNATLNLEKMRSGSTALLSIPNRMNAEATRDVKLDVMLALIADNHDDSVNGFEFIDAGLNAATGGTRERAIRIARSLHNSRFLISIAKLLTDRDENVSVAAIHALQDFSAETLESLKEAEIRISKMIAERPVLQTPDLDGSNQF